jgi:hypothetical protein
MQPRELHPVTEPKTVAHPHEDAGVLDLEVVDQDIDDGVDDSSRRRLL